MRKWTESEAIKAVTSAGASKTHGKTFSIKGGLSGLKACSAMDFLQNKCGYIFLV